MLRLDDPRAHLHVFGPDAAEPWRHRIFRDHLTRDAHDRALYESAKREASEATNSSGDLMSDYNRRKEQAIRDIYARAFASAGLS